MALGSAEREAMMTHLRLVHPQTDERSAFFSNTGLPTFTVKPVWKWNDDIVDFALMGFEVWNGKELVGHIPWHMDFRDWFRDYLCMFSARSDLNVAGSRRQKYTKRAKQMMSAAAISAGLL
jgi:hypothetical protein